MQTYKFIIKGKVQGVWYRKFVSESAKEEGFKGYIKNLPNKSVEALVNIKDESELKRFIEILKKGSPYSEVKEINYQKTENQNFEDFEIRY